MDILLQIIIAALSVMGFYFCLRTIASLIFTSRQIAAAVVIAEKIELYNLDLLIQDASSALFATKRRRIGVFIPTEIWNECSDSEKALVKELIDCFGAEIYLNRPLDL